eukprot:728010-Amphidinium_carterae.1
MQLITTRGGAITALRCGRGLRAQFLWLSDVSSQPSSVCSQWWTGRWPYGLQLRLHLMQVHASLIHLSSHCKMALKFLLFLAVVPIEPTLRICGSQATFCHTASGGYSTVVSVPSTCLQDRAGRKNSHVAAGVLTNDLLQPMSVTLVN